MPNDTCINCYHPLDKLDGNCTNPNCSRYVAPPVVEQTTKPEIPNRVAYKDFKRNPGKYLRYFFNKSFRIQYGPVDIIVKLELDRQKEL